VHVPRNGPVGPRQRARALRGRPSGALEAEGERQGCLFSLQAGRSPAHPEPPLPILLGQKPLEEFVEDILSLFTHIEGLNGCVHALQNRAVLALRDLSQRAGHSLTLVGGSDAHTLGRVGGAYTEARASTAEGFVDEIRKGRCGVGGSSQTALRLLADVNSNVYEYYRRLYTGRREAGDRRPGFADAAVATACLPAALGGLPSAVALLDLARQKIVSGRILTRLHGLDWNSLGALHAGRHPAIS